jgi:hypothetical protein
MVTHSDTPLSADTLVDFQMNNDVLGHQMIEQMDISVLNDNGTPRSHIFSHLVQHDYHPNETYNTTTTTT